MDTLAQLPLTGRKVDGPTAELIELQPDEGPLITAVQLEKSYRDMSRLGQSIELAYGFMTFPMVTGLVELKSYEAADGALLYPTGNSRSVAEILSTYRRAKKKVGARAAIELCYLGGMILGEAADTGSTQGVFSHGDLNPWRVLVRPDGELQIIGYGLPSPEVLRFRDDDSQATLADTWRYAPPERITGAPEDASSDIVSLCLIAAEMILGDPLLDGSPEAIRKLLEEGQLTALVNKKAKALGKPVAEVLAYAMNFDPRNRFESSEAFVTACEHLLEKGLKGESLAEAGQKVATTKRGKALKSIDDTAAMPISGRAIRPRGQKAVQEAIERAAEEDSRWETRGGRRGKKAVQEEEAPAETTENKRPRRRSKAAEDDEAPKRPRRRSEANAAVEANDTQSKRPRRRPTKEASEPEGEAKRPRRRAAASSDSDSARPRRRPTSSDDADDKPKRPRRRAQASEEASESSDAPKRPRRRTPAKTADAPEEAEAPARPRRRKRRTED